MVLIVWSRHYFLQFAAEVYKKVKENGHEIVGVFTIPDANNREDPVAAVAR